MSITNYSTLVAAILDRMDDPTLSPYVGEFIQLAEASFKRRLNTLDGEALCTAPAAAQMDLPTGYNGVRAVWLDDEAPISQLGADDFRDRYANQTAQARPCNYAIYSGSIWLAPTPLDGMTLNLAYLRKLTPLTETAPVNWLITEHPDLYLYASLVQAEARGWNDDRLSLLSGAADSIIAEINVQDARRRRGGRVDTVTVDYF